MEITVSGIRFNKALQCVAGVFKSKSKDNDYYNQILFTVCQDKIVINSMNERITTSEVIDTDIDVNLNEGVSEFRFLLEAGPVISYFKNAANKVKITLKEDGAIELKAKNGKFKTVWFPAGNYPTMFAQPMEDSITINSNTFVPMLKRAFSFTDDDEFREFLSTAKVTIDEESIEMITTDRFKIYRSINPFSYDGKEHTFLISNVIGPILYKFLEGCDEGVQLSISNDRARTYISFDGVTITDRIIEDKFPNCKPIFDLFKSKYEAEYKRDEIVKAIRSTDIMTDSPSVVLQLGSPTNIKCEFLATRKEFSVDVDTVEEVAFDDAPDFAVKRNDILCCVSNIAGSRIKIQHCPERHAMKFFSPERPNEYIICMETAKM